MLDILMTNIKKLTLVLGGCLFINNCAPLPSQIEKNPVSDQAASPIPNPDLELELRQEMLEKIVDGIDWPVIFIDEKSKSSNVDILVDQLVAGKHFTRHEVDGLNKRRDLTLEEINALAKRFNSFSRGDGDFSEDYEDVKKMFEEGARKTRRIINRIEKGKESEISITEAKSILSILEGRATKSDISKIENWSSKNDKGICLGLNFKVSKVAVSVDKPQLDSVRINEGLIYFDMPKVTTKVWIDVEFKYPWLCCSDRWCKCFCPKTCCKYSRKQLRPSVLITAKGHVYPRATTNAVQIRGQFERLRFKHDIVGLIPLEKFVNAYLALNSIESIPYSDFKQEFADFGLTINVDRMEFPRETGKLPMKIKATTE